MTAVFSHSRSKGTTRLVLLALADTASDDGEVTAYARSQMILRRKANASKASVGRAIDALVELGELEVLRLGDGRRSTDYRIRLEALTAEGYQDEDPQPDAPGVPECDPTGSTVSTQGAQDEDPISPSLPAVAPSLPISVPDVFDQFWSVYPRKIGKPAAIKAWGRAVKRAKPAEIIAAAESYARRRQGEDPAFTKHPGPWLNDDRWEAEATEAAAAAGPRLSRSTTSIAAWAERHRAAAEAGERPAIGGAR